MGAAIAGSALAAAMAHTIPASLDAVAGVPENVLSKLSDATQASAGSMIGQLRDATPTDPFTAPLGDTRSVVVEQLASGFADAAAWSIGFSALFLLLGLLGSVMVLRQSKKTPAAV